MDKPKNLRLNLAKIMFASLSEMDAIINEHLKKAQTYIKADGSPVTDLDLALSQELEKIASLHSINFYSEENIGEWAFPLMVVDPLDGTKEFIAGRDEWVVSVASLKSSQLDGEGWIYNPLRKKVYHNISRRSFEEKETYFGEASRSEWAKGYYKESFEQFRMQPMGSIAFKLARLAAGEIDFVVSLHPKNIWDIAAGTLLCKEAGMSFYAKGKKVTEFVPYFEGPLIWCFDELYPQLSKHFY
ncbi:MAG: inositol monophosphatase family protein [Bacteriovoracaceae bacterium]